MKNIISFFVFLCIPIISIAQPYGYTPRTGSGSSTFTGGTVTSTIVSTDGLGGPACDYSAGTLAGRGMAAGTTYQPLQPHLTESITRVNNVITVPMYVPTCPMALDTTIITGVSSINRGFEYTCGSSPPSISSIDCTSIACSNNIGYCTITLSGSPNASCQTDDFIGYAITGVNGNSGGPTSGPRGNIVDSSVPVNRLVHFKLPVPQ